MAVVADSLPVQVISPHGSNAKILLTSAPSNTPSAVRDRKSHLHVAADLPEITMPFQAVLTAIDSEYANINIFSHDGHALLFTSTLFITLNSSW